MQHLYLLNFAAPVADWEKCMASVVLDQLIDLEKQNITILEKNKSSFT